jgi:hypothetical protein
VVLKVYDVVRTIQLFSFHSRPLQGCIDHVATIGLSGAGSNNTGGEADDAGEGATLQLGMSSKLRAKARADAAAAIALRVVAEHGLPALCGSVDRLCSRERAFL